MNSIPNIDLSKGIAELYSFLLIKKITGLLDKYSIFKVKDQN